MPKIALGPEVARPLSAWVDGEKFFMKSFFHYENADFVPDTFFVAFDAVHSLHEAPDVPLKTLEQSWIHTKEYVTAACQLLGRQKPSYSLKRDDRGKVVEALGQPPGPAWPLYFFTVGDFPNERVVYIGKTNSEKTHRFENGHKATTALHAPSYAGLQKRLYLATVTVLTDEENYVPLEWLHPLEFRNGIWSELEARLIFYFQPTMNTGLKRSDRKDSTVPIVLHNYAGTRSFDGVTISPFRRSPN